MKANLTLIIVSLLLIITCISIMLFRQQEFDIPVLPQPPMDSWTIEAKIQFNANNSSASAEFYLPDVQNNYTIVHEQFVSPGYTVSTRTDRESNNRLAIFDSPLVSGSQIILYRAIIERMPKIEIDKKKMQTSTLTPYYKNTLPTLPILDNTRFSKAILNLISHIRKNTKDNLAFITMLYETLNDKDNSYVKDIYDNLIADPLPYRLVQYILYHTQIPYRITHMLDLHKRSTGLPFRQSLEIYHDGEWVDVGFTPYNEHDQATKSFTWWYGDHKVLNVKGGTHSDVDIFYRPNIENSTIQGIRKGAPKINHWLNFSFSNLPIETQSALSVLLLMPLGALIVCFCRQFIGIETYGTFTPVLISISFQELPFMWGVSFIATIISVGIIGRIIIERIQLLIVPKLTAIMTIIIGGLVMISLYSYQGDLNVTLSLGLLPIVILTMIVERISNSWDEYGMRETIMLLIGSIIVASICYLVLSNNTIIHLFFHFPELLLIVLAAAITMGRYRGYKLFELMRFKHIEG